MERLLFPILRDFADKRDFHTRPYVAILTATILAHLGHYEVDS